MSDRWARTYAAVAAGVLAVGVLYLAVAWQVAFAVNAVVAPRMAPEVIVVRPRVTVAPQVRVEQIGTNLGTFLATAYTACDPGMDCRGITTSGLRVRPGVVSVDPEVIPLGSILWIEGYGFAVAADTGSAIKGRRLDVYMEDVEDAMRWGRRWVQVVVLR